MKKDGLGPVIVSNSLRPVVHISVPLNVYNMSSHVRSLSPLASLLVGLYLSLRPPLIFATSDNLEIQIEAAFNFIIPTVCEMTLKRK